MRYVSQFDPSAAKSGTVQVGIADSGQKLLLTNLSAVNMILNFEDGGTDILHAGQANYWILENPTPEIEWSQQAVLNVSNIPISQCSVVIYNKDEPIIGTYPISLIYFSNVGNPNGVNTNVTGGANTLTNDGQTIGTVFIESTPLGSGSSAISITNDGILNIKTLTSGTLKSQIQTQNSGNGLLLSNTGGTTEVLGAMLIDQALTTTGNTILSGTLAVTLGQTIGGTLNVTGVTTHTGSVVANGGVSATSLAASSTLNVTGTSTLGTLNAGVTGVGNFISSGTIQTTAGLYYGNDASISILAMDGTGGTGRTRLQSSNKISFQVPVGTDIAHITSAGTFFDNPITLQGNNLNGVTTVTDTGGAIPFQSNAGSTTVVASPTSISFQVPKGTELAHVDANGIQSPNVFFTTGKVSRISHGNSSFTSGGATITHGLGATPDVILVTGTSGPSTATNSTASRNGTTFVGYSNSTLNYDWVCIKF